MSKSGKKPRAKFQAREFESSVQKAKKEEKDWSFDEIARMKTRGKRAW